MLVGGRDHSLCSELDFFKKSLQIILGLSGLQWTQFEQHLSSQRKAERVEGCVSLGSCSLLLLSDTAFFSQQATRPSCQSSQLTARCYSPAQHLVSPLSLCLTLTFGFSLCVSLEPSRCLSVCVSVHAFNSIIQWVFEKINK